MRRILLSLALVPVVASSAYGLTIDEAVEKALANNHEIKEYRFLSEQEKNTVEASRAPYKPGISAGYGYSRTSRDEKYGEQENSSADITISYNVYSGGAKDINLQSAKEKYQAQKHYEKSVEADLILDVKTAYINILKAKKDIEVEKEAVQLLERQLKDTRLSFEVGVVAKNEVLKVESELASEHQKLLVAESKLRTYMHELESYINEDISENDEFVDISGVEKKKLDEKKLYSELTENRSELKYLDGLVQSSELGAKSTLAGDRPRVDVSGAYKTYGDDFVPADRDYTYDDEFVVSASVSWSIFDGNSRKNTAAAQKAYANSLRQRLLKTKTDLKYALNYALEQYELAVSSLEVSEKEVEYAEENYRITENQYKQRVSTTTDLLDARTYLTRARNNYNKALYDMYKAMVEINRVVEKEVF
ncbi:TolC family protein [Limisalsivibrio acetivorans]|uniref:TolC family protein n=1 Tax=Limisalsivibrio acetivorans TaxID=1304888 RepID=UPI0003B5C898|nr:TolC family protein [Limisalsivibrio acetivorans]